ncbi:MAG: carbamate kinase [Candidatus Eisenbacteria bacterium]
MAPNTKHKLAVVAIGGNSLISDKAHMTVQDQYAAAHETCIHIADMIEHGWTVAITHGNGPQVGFILRRSELSAHELHEVPLDACDADTQGSIGYAVQQNLYNEFLRRGMKRTVATVVTQVEVDPGDPAFENPEKPIGVFMTEEVAQGRRKCDGWNVCMDAGRGWRRVVPSPKPIRIVEEAAIRNLLDAGIIVVAGGGGGIPVVADEEGNLKGTAAVIDKDYTSSLLARQIGADLLLIATSVEKVYLNFGQPDEKPLDRVTLAGAREYLARGGHFSEGSMAPKIRAIIEFLEHGGKEAIVTDPPSIEKALLGKTGTHFTQ